MNFEELGLTLQREREKKGLSIEVVMEATKISRTNIVAMENGDHSAMPHPVYAKGFVKSYARYLGLDAEELSMVIDNEFQDDSEDTENFGYDVSPQAEKAFHEPTLAEGKKKNIWPLMLLLVVLVVGAVLLVLNLKGNQSQDAEEAPVVTQEQIVPSEPAAPEVVEPEVEEGVEDVSVASQESEETSVATDEAVEQKEEEAAPAPEQPAVQETPVVEPDPEPQVAEETSEAASEKQKYDHMLVIRATTDKGCWIGIWKGDETEMYRDFVLKNGEPLRLNFNTPRRLRIGNASGVSVLYNGKTYELDPARGNIQTHRFGYE